MYHVSGGNLPYLLTSSASGGRRATTCKMLLVKNLCYSLDCKAFGGSRVTTR